MSHPQRKRRLKRAKRFRWLVNELYLACAKLGPGMVRRTIEMVLRKKTSVVLVPKGWRVENWLTPGTIVIFKDDPSWRKFSPFVPIATDDSQHFEAFLDYGLRYLEPHQPQMPIVCAAVDDSPALEDALDKPAHR